MNYLTLRRLANIHSQQAQIRSGQLPHTMATILNKSHRDQLRVMGIGFSVTLGILLGILVYGVFAL